MARVLKKPDYYKLVVLIYLFASYNRERAKILFSYASHHLIHNNFNTLYVERLALDLNLLNDNGTGLIEFHDTETAYRTNLKLMDETFNTFELIKIKTTIWDLEHKGYYE